MDWYSGVVLAGLLCCALGIAARLEVTRRRSPGVRLVRAAVAPDLACLTSSTSIAGEGGEVADEVGMQVEMVEKDDRGGRPSGDVARSCGSPAARGEEALPSIDGELEQEEPDDAGSPVKGSRAAKAPRSKASGIKGKAARGVSGGSETSHKGSEARQSSQRLIDADAAQQESWDDSHLGGITGTSLD